MATCRGPIGLIARTSPSMSSTRSSSAKIPVSTIRAKSATVNCQRRIWTVIALPRLSNGLHATRVLQGRQIARFLAQIRGPDHPAHDLGATGFGQLLHEEHTVRANSSTHGLNNAVNEFRPQDITGLEAWSQHGEAHHGLTFHVMRHTDGGGLIDSRMPHQHRLDFRWPHALARKL